MPKTTKTRPRIPRLTRKYPMPRPMPGLIPRTMPRPMPGLIPAHNYYLPSGLLKSRTPTPESKYYLPSDLLKSRTPTPEKKRHLARSNKRK
jgi:hypothetical protein